MEVFTMHESPIEEVPYGANVYFLGMPWKRDSYMALTGKLPYQKELFHDESFYRSVSDGKEKFSGYFLDLVIHERALLLLLHQASCVASTSPLLVMDKLSDKEVNYVTFPEPLDLDSLGFTNFAPVRRDICYNQWLNTPKEIKDDIYIKIRLNPGVVVQVREEL